MGRQGVLDGLRDALREQRGPVEAQELLLDHAPHEVLDLARAQTVAGLADEAVGVEQRHEQLEVLVLAVVWRGGHQQQVAGVGAEQLAELVQLSLLHLTPEDVRREAVSLVEHHEIPGFADDSILQLGVARQLVHPSDPEVPFDERVPGAGVVDVGAGEHVERQPELLVELVLPLLHQRPGGDDEAAAHVTAQHQLLDEQPSHDGLAGTRVVGEQEAQRLTRQHLLVHGADLVRQRFDRRGEHRLHRIEEMGEADALRLRREAEEVAVGGEGELRRGRSDIEVLLLVPVQNGVTQVARRGAEHEGARRGAGHGGGDHLDRAGRIDAAHPVPGS